MKRRRSLDRSDRLRSILVTCAVAGIVILAIVDGMRLHCRTLAYQAEVTMLESRIKEEEQRKKDLEEYRETIHTEDFIKNYARKYFNLLEENEIILIAE